MATKPVVHKTRAAAKAHVRKTRQTDEVLFTQAVAKELAANPTPAAHKHIQHKLDCCFGRLSSSKQHTNHEARKRCEGYIYKIAKKLNPNVKEPEDVK